VEPLQKAQCYTN